VLKNIKQLGWIFLEEANKFMKRKSYVLTTEVYKPLKLALLPSKEVSQRN